MTVPYAAKLLADLGADVVKVEESPGGDPARGLGPFIGDRRDGEHSALFQYLNAGKHGALLDLDTDPGREALRQLIRSADIFLLDQSLARVAAMHLTFDDVKRLNDRVAFVWVTPFGLTGPYRAWRGCNMVLSHLAALGKVTHWEGMDPEAVPPQRPAGYFVDFTAGCIGAIAALAALEARDVQGRAQMADVSGWEAAVLATFPNMLYPTYEQRGLNFRRPHLTARAPMGYMRCKDGYFWAAVLQPRHWESFTTMLGVADLAQEPLFSTPMLRGQYWDVLEPILNAKIADWSKDDLFHTCQKQGIPIVPVYSVEEALASEQLRSREFLTTVDHPELGPLPMPRNPCQLPDAPPSTTRAPRLGEHTAAILAEATAPMAGRPHPSGGDAGRLPLEGIRVLDFSWVLAGPLATQMLSHLGADVIKVESDRVADIARTNPPFADGREDSEMSGFFASLCAGKRTTTLDLTNPEGLALAKRLVSHADLVVENFSPGTLDRLGLGYEELRKIKPDIILLSISGAGQTGPWSRYRFFGLQIFGASGLSALTSPPDAPPAVTRAGGADPIGAIYGALSALAALRHRKVTGRGQWVDVAMLEATLAHLPDAVLDVTVNRTSPRWTGNAEDDGAPADCYRCRGEDAWVAIAVHTRDEWAGLCRAMGRADLETDARFHDAEARRRNERELRSEITRWTAGLDPTEAMAALQREGVPAGVSYDVRAALDDPHFRERGFMELVDHHEAGHRSVAGVPWKMSGVPAAETLRRVPRRNEHTAEVLREVLGLSEDDVARLAAAGAIPAETVRSGDLVRAARSER